MLTPFPNHKAMRIRTNGVRCKSQRRAESQAWTLHSSPRGIPWTCMPHASPVTTPVSHRAQHFDRNGRMPHLAPCTKGTHYHTLPDHIRHQIAQCSLDTDCTPLNRYHSFFQAPDTHLTAHNAVPLTGMVSYLQSQIDRKRSGFVFASELR